MIIEKARKLIARCYTNEDLKGTFLNKEEYMVPAMERLMNHYGSENCEKISIIAMNQQKKALRFDMEWLELQLERQKRAVETIENQESNPTKEAIKRKHYPDGIYTPERWLNSGVPYGDLTHLDVYFEQLKRERAEKKKAESTFNPLVSDLAKLVDRH